MVLVGSRAGEVGEVDRLLHILLHMKDPIVHPSTLGSISISVSCGASPVLLQPISLL